MRSSAVYPNASAPIRAMPIRDSFCAASARWLVIWTSSLIVFPSVVIALADSAPSSRSLAQGQVAGPGCRFNQLDSGMDDGQIVEENLMYDLVTFMKQLGLSD